MRKFEIAKGYQDKEPILPKRGTKNSAGYDFSVLHGATLKPGETHVFETGIKARMEEDEVLLIFIRSSSAIKKGLSLVNHVAVIDADYYGNEKNDGHIMIVLRNDSDSDVNVQDKERIAQGIFVKYLTVEDDDVQDRRVGGVGSTNH